MQNNLRLTIKVKILMIALVALLGFSVITTYQYIVNQDNNSRLNAVKNIYYPVLEHLDSNLVRLDNIINNLNAAVSDGEIDMIEDTDLLATNMRDSFKSAGELDKKSTTKTDQLTKQFNDYYSIARNLSTGMIEEKLSNEQIQNSIQLMSGKLNSFRQQLNTLHDSSYINFTNALETSKQASTTAMNIVITISLICIAVLISTALFISEKISTNLNRVVDSLKKIASGDLTCELQSNSRDEVGDVVDNCNILIKKLRNALGDVANSASKISVSAEALMSTAEKSSCHAQDQQGRLEQVATATNEMTSSIQEVASATTSAASAANDANSEANGGTIQASKAVKTLQQLQAAIDRGSNAVEELQQESNNIGTVLDVIRSIAEQTNLLALNAAIEAARAGDAGRGFAVVADEVRTLASRTQEATAEIQSMIEKLQNRSTHAVSVMTESGKSSNETESAVNNGADALKKMSEHAININNLNTQIATATEQQSIVAEEINRNIHEISDFSRQTADEARLNSDESKALTELAGHLQILVGEFKI